MFNNSNQPRTIMSTSQITGLNAFMTHMYSLMGISILISALVAYYVDNIIHYQMSGGVYIIALIAWFIIPFVASRQAFKNVTASCIGLMFYAALTGFIFSSFLKMYTTGTVTEAFVSSAAVFGGMSLIGYTTHKNMAKLGTQLFGALIGLIVASFINMFFYNSLINLLISIVAVIIYSLLTMYDTKSLKDMYLQNSDMSSGLAVFGAIQLYIDFIGIFMDLLEIFGNNNN